jgi:hypothetical protein
MRDIIWIKVYTLEIVDFMETLSLVGAVVAVVVW